MSPAEKIDRLGELERRIQLFSPTLAEHKILKEEIVGWYADAPADAPVVVEGLHYALQLTARENERTIVNPKKAFELLRKAIGMEALVTLITIPLGAAVDKFIPKTKHPQFLTQERTGSRKFTLVAKRSVEPTEAA